MKPILQALLLADRVYTDKDTGKKIVAGIFQTLLFKKPEELKRDLEGQGKAGVPGGLHAGSPYAYVSLTDVRGTQAFALRYMDLNEDTQVFQTAFAVNCSDPLQSVEVVVPLPLLPATKPGVYALELLWNDEPLGSFRVNVQELQTGGSGDHTSGDD